MSARTLLMWRHGRTGYNADGRLQGQVDIPLDEVGLRQARAAAQALALRHAPHRIVTSDLGRAVRTAQALADETGLQVETDARLRERGFGDWEGLTAEEIAERWPQEHAVWRGGRDPERTGAETRAEVAGRMAAAVREHARATPAGSALVVVSHGAAITLGLTALLDLDVSTWRGLAGLHNAHWSVLRASTGDARPGWRLEAHNQGPSVHIDDWNNEGVAASLPSSAADALRT